MAKEAAKKEAVAPPSVPPETGYQTFDGDEANRYAQAGGHIVSITPRYQTTNPDRRMYRSGKRYLFLESKAQLDALKAKSEEEVG